METNNTCDFPGCGGGIQILCPSPLDHPMHRISIDINGNFKRFRALENSQSVYRYT